MPPTSTVAILRCRINFLGQGNTESYIIPGTDYASALTVARKLCLYRRGLFALGMVMPFASVSFLGSEREARAAIDAPLGPHPKIAEKIGQTNEAEWYPNDPVVGVMYRFETASGKWANRIFRGIADYWISKWERRETPWVAYATGDPSIVGENDVDASINTYIRSALAFMRDNTLWHSEVKPATDPRSWNVDNWVSLTYRKVGKHDIGRPFGQLVGRRT